METIRASVLNGYVELARIVGLDPLRMLDAAGIPRAALADPDLRIPSPAIRDLMEQSGRGAEDFALRMSELRSPSLMGPVALIAREQPNVRGVIDAVVRYTSLHSEATSLHVEDVDDLVIIRFHTSFPTPGPTRQSVELSLGQLMRMLRLYLGSSWRPHSVSLIHSPPKSMETHRRILGPNIAFDQAFNAVVCTREDFDRPNPSADPEMARQIERYIQRLAEAAEASPPDKVREMIRDLLSAGRATVESVARKMGVDPRTLQRQLAAEGTSFIDLLQEVRMAQSGQYLEESQRPLAEVSELLGFSALSAFSRWHRTHYGCSASDRRKTAAAKGMATQ